MQPAGRSMQWESVRGWELAAGASEFVRAEGALHLSAGLRSFSVFFHRYSQSAGTFELKLWTAPVFFDPLDTDFSQTPATYLLNLGLDPANGLQMSGTAKQLFGGRVRDDQPLGELLFWEVVNTGGAQAGIVGAIYLVPNSLAVVSTPNVGRVMVDSFAPVAGRR